MSKKTISEEQFFESGKVIKDGVEWPENTPVALPIGYEHPPSISQMIAQMVRHELEMRDEMGEDVDEVEREEDFNLDEEGEELLTPAELHYMAAQEKEALIREGAVAKKKAPVKGPDGASRPSEVSGPEGRPQPRGVSRPQPGDERRVPDPVASKASEEGEIADAKSGKRG